MLCQESSDSSNEQMTKHQQQSQDATKREKGLMQFDSNLQNPSSVGAGIIDDNASVVPSVLIKT